jgi:urea transport system ATP-binding protein
VSAGPNGTARGVLEVRRLSVVFDGFKAIDGLDLTVDEGEVRFVIGPNGAGKTTLIDVITGMTRPQSGTVRFDGQSLLGKAEFDIVAMGVGRTFQTPSVFEQLSVLENLDLAASFRRPLRQLLRRRRGVQPEVASALETVGLAGRAEAPAGVLSHGQKQWLEIGMLLVQGPKLLLLDEPVAGMSKDERSRTGELLHEIARTRTVIVVEHDMEFLRRFASRVTVMHEGRVLCEGTVAEVQADPHVQAVYLGRSRDTRTGADL